MFYQNRWLGLDPVVVGRGKRICRNLPRHKLHGDLENRSHRGDRRGLRGSQELPTRGNDFGSGGVDDKEAL